MSDEPRHGSKRRWRWLVGGILVVLLFAVGGPLWVNWPARTKEQAASLLSEGRFEQVRGMLADPSAIQVRENGEVTITATNGKSVTLRQSELPLRLMADFESRPKRDGLLDVLAGRYQFELSTAGESVQRERAEPKEIQLDAVRGKVEVVNIVQH